MPPFPAAAVQVSTTWVSPVTACTPAGAEGIAYGVTGAEGVVHSPAPTTLTARTRNTYAVPLIRPVTVAFSTVDVPSGNVVQVLPPLLLYATS